MLALLIPGAVLTVGVAAVVFTGSIRFGILFGLLIGGCIVAAYLLISAGTGSMSTYDGTTEPSLDGSASDGRIESSPGRHRRETGTRPAPRRAVRHRLPRGAAHHHAA